MGLPVIMGNQASNAGYGEKTMLQNCLEGYLKGIRNFKGYNTRLYS